jgi:hypothetical protein
VPVQTFGIAAKPSRPSLEHKPRAVRESLVDLKFVSLCGDSIVRVVLALSQCVQECLGGFRRYQGRGYVNALIIFVLIPMLSCFGDQIALMQGFEKPNSVIKVSIIRDLRQFAAVALRPPPEITLARRLLS